MQQFVCFKVWKKGNTSLFSDVQKMAKSKAPMLLYDPKISLIAKLNYFAGNHYFACIHLSLANFIQFRLLCA